MSAFQFLLTVLENFVEFDNMSTHTDVWRMQRRIELTRYRQQKYPLKGETGWEMTQRQQVNSEDITYQIAASQIKPRPHHLHSLLFFHRDLA